MTARKLSLHYDVPNRPRDLLFFPSIIVVLALYAGIRWLDSALDLGGAEEVTGQIPSPDGSRTASIVELSGTLSGLGYSVRVDGKEAAMAYKAVRADGRNGVLVRWPDAQTVEVSFRHARFVREGKIPGLKVVIKGSVDAD